MEIAVRGNHGQRDRHDPVERIEFVISDELRGRTPFAAVDPRLSKVERAYSGREGR
jgi:hypothetical protein